MSFPLKEGSEQKQHVNLSQNALAVIDNDLLLFDCDCRNRFINNLFSNFRESAKASISKTLETEREELRRNLAGMKDEVMEACVAKLIKNREEELTLLAGSYEKGTGIRIRISNENYDYLTQDPECKEEKYYKNRIGRYLKALIEEYALLSYSDRELVYYSDIVSVINQAIENHFQLRIKLKNNNIHHLSPYCIATDALSRTHYLIGLRKVNDDPANSQYADSSVSFRLTNISACRIIKKSSGLKKNICKKLEEEIAVKGCQFMSSETNDIIVEMTEEGIRKYNSVRHLRPTAVTRAGNRFMFNCTETQIRYYFFGFGKDATIIYPSSLARDFQYRYLQAVEKYNNIKEDS